MASGTGPSATAKNVDIDVDVNLNMNATLAVDLFVSAFVVTSTFMARVANDPASIAEPCPQERASKTTSKVALKFRFTSTSEQHYG